MKKNLFIIALMMLLASCSQPKESENLQFPDKLIGVETHYTYSGGNEYVVKFEEDGLSYQYRSGSAPEQWWGKFQYNHMMTDKNEHFVSWFEPGYGDYVTLLINFEDDLIYGSAIIKGKTVHFQDGTIQSVSKP